MTLAIFLFFGIIFLLLFNHFNDSEDAPRLVEEEPISTEDATEDLEIREEIDQIWFDYDRDIDGFLS